MKLAREEGNALVSVLLVSMLLAALTTLTLASGEQAERASVRDRNHDLALGIAEAGVHQVIAHIENSSSYVDEGFCPPEDPPPTVDPCRGETPQGPYNVAVARNAEGNIQIESTGTVLGDQLGRSRKVRVTLVPPRIFANSDSTYAFFSATSITVKNGDKVRGDVWANTNLTLEPNSEVDGSLTAANGWILMQNLSRVTKDVTSGNYYNQDDARFGRAIDLENNATIGGKATAAVAAPSYACETETQRYNVVTATGATIDGVTACGVHQGLGAPGNVVANTFVAAPPPLPMPTFEFRPADYDPATYHEFSSFSDFRDLWLESNCEQLEGAVKIWITDHVSTQADRIDLGDCLPGQTPKLKGDLTIYTNAPIFTNGISDPDITDKATFVLATTYRPQGGTPCNAEQDASDCAVFLKNAFQPTCRTKVLVYASDGPVAVKNNGTMCGSIVSDGMQVKNNQTIDAAQGVDRVIGFGSTRYEIANWTELAS